MTGFGKQTDILVIFKEHEIYSAEYVSETPTRRRMIDGKVVDVTANAAIFPITPINSGIGCDCPNTIQLCNNRLIWATSDGAVYGLMAANQASERNVRKLSVCMIESRLKAEDRYLLKSALSCDVDGHYMLFVWNRVYLLDYMDGVFQYYATYSDERKAQRNMSWYCWEFPEECVPAAVMPKGDRCLSAFCLQYHSYDRSGMPTRALFGAAYLLTGEGLCLSPERPAFETGEFDISVEDREIQSCFQTKVFDFGSQNGKRRFTGFI